MVHEMPDAPTKKTIIEFRRGPADGLFCVWHGLARPSLNQDSRLLACGKTCVPEYPTDPTWERWCMARYHPSDASKFGHVLVVIAEWHPEPASTPSQHSS
jgi:hypothetical protein